MANKKKKPCKDCAKKLSGYTEVEGLEKIDYMNILGLTTGYVAGAKVGSKLKAYSVGKTSGIGKQMANDNMRNGLIAITGLALNAYGNMTFLEDMGKGACIYGIKEIIAKQMPTMGINGIGNPNTVPVIGNPNTVAVIGNEKEPTNMRSINQAANNDKYLESLFPSRLTGQPTNDENVRLTGYPSTDVRLTGHEGLKISY
jgi:hypothetical protein